MLDLLDKPIKPEKPILFGNYEDDFGEEND